MRVGFVGAGRMGAPMVTRLSGAGHDVRVLARSPERASAITELGAQPVPDLRKALQLCEQSADVWVIGGAQLYALTEPLASTAVVTEIEQDFAGDAFAPTLGEAWKETARERQVAANGLAFSFVTYTRS